MPVTSFGATKSVFYITKENNNFSIITLSHWSFRGGVATNNKLRELLALRELNDIKLHVEDIRKRGYEIKIGDIEYKLSGLDTRKNEIIKEFKNIDYNDLEDMAFRMELTYSEIESILDKKYFDTSTTGYTLPPRISEISDSNSFLKSLLPDEVKVKITIDDITLKSNLTTNKIFRFTKSHFSTQY